MQKAARKAGRGGGIAFHHPVAFWAGILSVTAGVALHLPMFIGARSTGYRLAGMPVDSTMVAGMALILLGTAATAFGLLPGRAGIDSKKAEGLRISSLDEARLTWAHLGLLLATSAAVTIDLMKPATLGFVAPGVAREYHLKSALFPHAHTPVALLPLAGIGGTVLGSMMWGWLGDRIGRRASVLLAAVIFIGTSICGSMPSFSWNLVMCFVMGVGVGGMLPIAFALLAETIPARHRGWLMVLIGGDVAGAYIITSKLASWLEPAYSWRIMWLLGLPTGLALILLNRWIPESPRFLIVTGRAEEAARVMARFGVGAVAAQRDELGVEDKVKGGFDQLLRRPFAGLTLGIGLFALALGLVNFGFLLWLPTNLRKLGMGVVTADKLLFESALIGFPVTFLVAFLYGFWSSKKTMVMLALVTAATLFGFAYLGDAMVSHTVLLRALIAVILASTSSLLAVLTPYSSEVYPTKIRSRGTGLAAAASKAGGVIGIGLVAASVAPPSIAGSAVMGGIPTALAAAAVWKYGVETRSKRLEEISAEELLGTTAATPA